MKFKKWIGPVLAGIAIVLAVAVHIPALAENVRIPLFGSTDAHVYYINFDTAATGDLDMSYGSGANYVLDTLSAYGYDRTDGLSDFPSRIPVWKYDGFKMYLNMSGTSAAGSLFVRVRLGNADTNYVVTEDSAEGASLERIFDYSAYYDNDSTILIDWMRLEVMAADTTKVYDTDSIADEKQVPITVRGYLIGKD